MVERLGGVPKAVRDLIDYAAALRPNSYRLRWRGDKIPTGASVGGVPIAWTQNGVVTAGDGSTLGYYRRTVEFGGESGREQEMVISCDGEVEPGPGQSATLIPKCGRGV